MKKKNTATEKKSAAAQELGGQPENDQDARDAGATSATATTAKPPRKKTGREAKPRSSSL